MTSGTTAYSNPTTRDGASTTSSQAATTSSCSQAAARRRRLWALIGLGVGALVRNQVATLVGLCAWMLLVENLLLPFVPDAGRFTPGAAGLALAGSVADKLLAPGPAALVLIVFAAAAGAGGWLATLRRYVA